MDGLKFDCGKLRWDLLPLDVVEKLVEIYEFGANKYGENNWRNLQNGYKRCRAALFRHLTAYDKGEQVDPESGKSHLAHAAWNALSMVYFAERERKIQPLSQDMIVEIGRIAHKDALEPPAESSSNPLSSSTFAFSIGELVSLVGHPYTYDFITNRKITRKGKIYFTPKFGWSREDEITPCINNQPNETTTIHQE